MPDPVEVIGDVLDHAEKSGIIESYEKIPDENGYGYAVELSDEIQFFLAIERI